MTWATTRHLFRARGAREICSMRRAKYRIRAVITADDFDSDVYAGFWEVEEVARQPD